MDNLAGYLAIASCIGYFLSAGLWLKTFFSHESGKQNKSAPSLFGGSILLHIVVSFLSFGSGGIELSSMTFIFSFIAMLISLTMFIATRFTKNLVFLPIVSIVSAVSLLLLMFFPQDIREGSGINNGLILHISLSMISFGLYAISTLFALQLVFIHHQLKHKKKSLLRGDLPPLMWVENILRKLMQATLLLLLSTLITGYVFVPQFLADGYAHKSVLSTFALLVLVTTLAVDKTKGLSSHSMLWLNALGMALLFLSYFGARFVREVILA